ncbi:MAG: DUF692 family multinuclear iron-containing protein [Pseudomonadota bacterium]
MPSQKFSHLGFGLGFRPCHYTEILKSRPKSINWLEVITENFLTVGGKPRRILEEARDIYPVAIHGVGLSIGSPDNLNKTYLKNLKELTSWLKPALVSDHLCFTTFNKHNSHDLLPLHYTKAILERVTNRVNEIQDLLGQRFMLKNSSAYVTYENHDMPEVEFLCRLVEKTSCGVLLDVNNLFVNQMNLGEDPVSYIKALPKDSVGQIHLAGHSVETNELGTVRIDTHDHPVNDEVWTLFQMARHKWPNASPMIEWDDHIPALTELTEMLDFARVLPPIDVQTASTLEFTKKTPGGINYRQTADQGHAALFSLAIDSDGVAPEDSRLQTLAANAPVPKLLGTRVYNNAYFSRLRDVLRDEFPTLAGVTTDDGFTEIAASYLATYAPSDADIGLLGKNLSQHLDSAEIPSVDFGVSMSALADIARLDRARAEAFTHESSIAAIPVAVLAELTPDQWEYISFQFSPTANVLNCQNAIAQVWAAINKNEPAVKPGANGQTIIVWRTGEHSEHKVMSDGEALLFSQMHTGTSFAQATKKLSETLHESLEDTSSKTIAYMMAWFDMGIITGVRLEVTNS